MQAIIVLFLMAATIQPSDAKPASKYEVSAKDRAQIEIVIRRITNFKILGMNNLAEGKVQVWTGVVRGMRDGEGRIFIMQRAKRGWVVKSNKRWIS